MQYNHLYQGWKGGGDTQKIHLRCSEVEKYKSYISRAYMIELGINKHVGGWNVWLVERKCEREGEKERERRKKERNTKSY